MEYWFLTDARPWALLCCQTLIPATLQLGHIQRGYVYTSVCEFETICSELYSLCVRMCVYAFGLVPLYGVQCNGSGLLHVLPQQHLAMRPIQVCHLDTRCPRIRPVQFVMDPVYGQST